MIVWSLVIISAFTSALNLARLDATAEIRSLAKQIFKQHGLNAGAPIGCLSTLTNLTLLALWIAYAIQIGDWRFAAITCLPWLVAFIATPLHDQLTKGRRV